MGPVVMSLLVAMLSHRGKSLLQLQGQAETRRSEVYQGELMVQRHLR